jgi:arylsulfatase A-like enzyme
MQRWILLLLVAGLAGCSAGDSPNEEARQPIVVIGIDSADWTWLDGELAAGNMPNLQALLDRGARADLPSLQPPQKSPTIWTSIATGMRPSRHGVADFITHEKGITGSSMRQAATYWEILGALGRSQAVIGWWVTFPATRVNGVLVTDYLQYGSGRDQMIDASIYPDRYWEMIGPLRVNQAKLGPEELGRFIDLEVYEREGERAERAVETLAWTYSADQSYRRIARALYEDATAKGVPYDVFTVYFRGLDVVSHRYWASFKPGQGGAQAPDWEQEMCADLITNYIRYVDELVGEVLEYVDARSRILICSDHGFHGNRRTREGQARGIGMHDDDGILVMAGPGIREGVVLESEGLDVQNIASTLLLMAGMPPAKNIDGQAWLAPFTDEWQKFAARLAEDAVETYEDIVPSRDPTAEVDPAIEAEALERLKALGYIE